VDIKLFIHIHTHRCPSCTGLGLHVGLCTEYPQSADGLYYYTILTIATSVSIPYLVSK